MRALYLPILCPNLLIILLLQFVSPALAQSVKNVHLGFPEAWDGDKYPELYCPAKGIPKFIDGFFLCQLSAAYGNPNAPAGQRLTHMIDAIGAIGSFRISNGEVVFSARYYPSRPFHIWQFYDRNMSKSSVPWAGWSDYNLTAMSRWEQVPPNPDTARFHPNLDFWRIGQRVIAGTEAPYWIGYEFDVPTLSQFKFAPLTEDNDVFGGSPRPGLIPISMAMHERADLKESGTIWGTFSAMNFDEERFFQGLFTIDSKGVRRIVGMYDFGVWNGRACAKDDEYIGDKSQLPGYIHSLASTEHFIVLPITSLIINPCKFKEPPRTGSGGGREADTAGGGGDQAFADAAADGSHIQSGGLWGMDFYDMVPMRFLIFDKRTRSWVTQKPLEVFPSMFVTHQLNAFEDLDGNIVADMTHFTSPLPVVYDSHAPYVKYFYTDFLRTELWPSAARVLRFTLDIRTFRVMYSYLVPQETLAVDFPQVNHAFESRPYQWAYLLEHPYAGGNAILKINVNEPTGARNSQFRPADSQQLVLHEPFFHPRPGASKEDDGVLLVRALDLEENKGLLLVVDAATMQELGRAIVPISVPFGFHNRFFSTRELGFSSGTDEGGGGAGAGGGDEQETAHQRQLRRKQPHTGGPFFGNMDRRGFWSGRVTSTTARPPPVSWVPVMPGDANTEEPGPPPPPPSSNEQQPAAGRRLPGSAAASLLLPWAQTPAITPWWPRTTRPVRAPDSSASPTAPVPFEPPSPPESGGQQQQLKKPTPLPNGGRPLTVRQLYERTLRALCRWLPRLLSGISYQGCVTSGQKAIRWVQPLARTLQQQSHQQNSPEEEEEEPSVDEPMGIRPRGRAPPRLEVLEPRGHGGTNGWFRPVLRPPAAQQQTGQKSSPKQQPNGPWYNQQQQRRGDGGRRRRR